MSCDKLNQHIRGFHSWPWSEACHQLQRQGQSFVLVTLMGTNGSTPRGSGTKMVITADDIYDTIGGGHLELLVIQKARSLLLAGESTQQLEHFPLGASLGQCCGGSVAVMLECLISDQLQLDVYGAGHVAHALMSILGSLPIKIRWIDQRADLFPDTVANNISRIVDEQPLDQVKIAAKQSAFLVLTHNHQLDFELVQAVLKRGDAMWLGVIGSETKAKRFRQRLLHKQFSLEQIDGMTCPVGLPDVKGKLPMEVAVSITGQLISLYQTVKTTQRQGVAWRELKQVLVDEKVAIST